MGDLQPIEVRRYGFQGETVVVLHGGPGAAERLPADQAGNVETWADALRLQREGVEPQVFAKITARVLMVHGNVDPHPGAMTRDVLRRFVPHLEYVELERCGHEPWRERHARDRFIQVVGEWVRGRGAGDCI